MKTSISGEGGKVNGRKKKRIGKERKGGRGGGNKKRRS